MRRTLTINGRSYAVDAPPDAPLLSILRDTLNLTGTRFGCGQGACGACYVLADGRAVPSCTMSIDEAAGREIVTIEGLAQNGRLHPVQQAFVDHDALQCGYCTSGVLIAAVALRSRTPDPTDEQAREALAPHLCRCGVYQRMIQAVRGASPAPAGPRPAQPEASGMSQAGRTAAPGPRRAPLRVESRLRIEPDGTVVVFSGKVEFGQGIRTAFARIVAQELRVPLASVRVVLGETDDVPWDMGTFGSMSVANDGLAIRRAAAFMRERLLDLAAAALQAPRAELSMHDGRVSAPAGGSMPYADLTANGPIAGDVPDEVPILPPGETADAPMRLEARAVVTGAARYAADVRLPGLLRGHAVAPPVYGAHLRAVDDTEARGMPGVVAIVHEDGFAGVVAERADQARAAARALAVEWDPPHDVTPPVDLTMRDDAGVDEAIAAASLSLSARFVVPHVAHASIGTSAAVADVQPGGDTHLYVATQRPFPLRDAAAAILDVPKERVHVHPQVASGTYGRNGGSDAALEAVRLSRAAGRPVLVEWTRAEEFRLSPCRPEVIAEVRAGLDRAGRLAGWRYEEWTNPHAYGSLDMPLDVLAMTSGRNAIPPYRTPVTARLHVAHAKVRTGALRSLAAAPNVFASESFMDELASRARLDPIDFRLRHLDDPRLRRVLEAARDLSGWTSRVRDAGRGYGVACTVYHGTYVAEVVEATVGASGEVRIERVWCAADPGRIVHPDGARQQAEGGIQQAASWALFEALTHADGRVTAGSFTDYPIATFRDAPRAIDVVFTGSDHDRSTGMGEPSSVPLAAALANAVFDACGARVRTLPLTAEAVRSATPNPRDPSV